MSGSEEEIAEAARRIAAWVDLSGEGPPSAWPTTCGDAVAVARAYLALLSQSHTAKERAWEPKARHAIADMVEASTDILSPETARKLASRIRSASGEKKLGDDPEDLWDFGVGRGSVPIPPEVQDRLRKTLGIVDNDRAAKERAWEEAAKVAEGRAAAARRPVYHH